MATGSKCDLNSSRMNPAEGLRRLISAITRTGSAGLLLTTAEKQFRAGSSWAQRTCRVCIGVLIFALATSTRLRAMIFSRMDAVADMRGRFIALGLMNALVVGTLHPAVVMGEVIAVEGSVD